MDAYPDRCVIIFSEIGIRTRLCLTVQYPPPSLIEFFIIDEPGEIREVALNKKLPSRGRNLLGPFSDLCLHRQGRSRNRFLKRHCHLLGGWLNLFFLRNLFLRGALVGGDWNTRGSINAEERKKSRF